MNSPLQYFSQIFQFRPFPCDFYLDNRFKGHMLFVISNYKSMMVTVFAHKYSCSFVTCWLQIFLLLQIFISFYFLKDMRITPKKLVPILKPGTSFVLYVLMKWGQPQKLGQVLVIRFGFSEFKKWGQYGCQS